MITLFIVIYAIGIVKKGCIKACTILIRPFLSIRNLAGKGHNNRLPLISEDLSSGRIKINHTHSQFYTNYGDIMVSSIKGI